MIRIAIVIALVAGLGGCKKKQSDPPAVDFRSDWKTLLDLRDVMCRCPDRVCAADALDRLKKWSSTGAKRDYKPSDTQIKDMDRIKQEMNNCMVKAMASSVDVAPPGPPPPAPKPTQPAAAKQPISIDQLIALARDFAPIVHPQLVIASIDATYIDAEGALDEQDGALTVILGTAAPTDDPKRRVGAPVKPRPAAPTECKKLVWTLAAGWTTEPYGCIEARRPFPLCTVVEIWNRAIAKGAPGDAVAVVQLREATPRRWVFTIVDEPRKISIQHFLPDDCELSLEKQ